MRGEYKVLMSDRRIFYWSLLELMRKPNEWLNMSSTSLNLCNCDDFLEELGYERGECDINGWEGDMWWNFDHPSAPSIVVNAEGYIASLRMAFSDVDDGKEIDTNALQQVIKEKWSKYFEIV